MSDFDRFAIERASYDSDLPPTSRLVLWALLQHVNDRGACWPSIATIQRATGLSERAVRQHLRTLERAGWIEVSEATGRSSTYTIQGGGHLVPGRGAGDAPLNKNTGAPRAGEGGTSCRGGGHLVPGRGAGDAGGGAGDAPRTYQEQTNEQEHPTPPRMSARGGEGELALPSAPPPPAPMPQDTWPEAPPTPPLDELAQALAVVEAYLTTTNPTWGGSISRRERHRVELRQLLRHYGAEVVEAAAASMATQALEGLEVVSPVGFLRHSLERSRLAHAPSPGPIRRQARPGSLRPPVAPPAPLASSKPSPPPTSPERPERPDSGHMAFSYDPAAQLPTRWHDAADGGLGNYVLEDEWDRLEALHHTYTPRPTSSPAPNPDARRACA